MYNDNNKTFGGRAVNAVENDVRSLTRIAFTYISFYVEKSLQHYNMSFNYIKRLYFPSNDRVLARNENQPRNQLQISWHVRLDTLR